MSFLKVIYRQRQRVIIAVVLFLVFYHLISRQSHPQQSKPPHVAIPKGQQTPQTIPVKNLPLLKDNTQKAGVPPRPLDNPIDGGNVPPSNPEALKGHQAVAEAEPEPAPISNEELENYAIDGGSLKAKYKTEKAKELFSTHDSFLFSKEYLENVLDISDKSFESLKASHEDYVEIQMNKLIDIYGLNTFGNILKTDSEWETYSGSSGYVLVGGGRYSWLSYLVIRQIRATGAKKPIELFLSNEEEYEKDFCEVVLPKYNARCNVFDTKLALDLKKRFNLGGYQYKMLALMSSKFENVLYLDSDNFPTRNMDYLFESDLFKKNGLILWPDAWARTTNPKYYDIAGIKVKENKLRYSAYDKKEAEKEGLQNVKPLSEYNFKNSWFHDFEGALPDPTSETGMLLINRTSHLRTLLLCLYYNVFGPDYYYPLLTQGSAGEGDKETFIAAATAMGEPYFQTLRQFKWTGYVSQVDNKFTSKALAHYDPIQSLNTEKEDIDIIFMHLSYPKYYPNWLVDNHDLVYKESGDHIRMYESINENVGYDFDLRVLQFFTQALCPNYYDEETKKPIDGQEGIDASEYMGSSLIYVKYEEEKNRKRCEEVFIPHLRWLKETTKFKEGSVIV
ncbi:mannosyltransferase putative-domain-containing protein [Scheffersomyces xylosifermentans]|uniref:mannosyltransferase putative-domain-containing protein n=1 Tax=Scheffersomyces xylosifermentans TaxID=1304137 RepID=UPI00315DEF29